MPGRARARHPAQRPNQGNYDKQSRQSACRPMRASPHPPHICETKPFVSSQRHTRPSSANLTARSDHSSLEVESIESTWRALQSSQSLSLPQIQCNALMLSPEGPRVREQPATPLLAFLASEYRLSNVGRIEGASLTPLREQFSQLWVAGRNPQPHLHPGSTPIASMSSLCYRGVHSLHRGGTHARRTNADRYQQHAGAALHR